MIDEFKKPNSESQYLTELKEMKEFPNESVWDFDQRFKTMMDKVSFKMSDVQDNEWFIVTLLHYICMSLMQQKITSQVEAMEIVMKLEASKMGEMGIGMIQIELQLVKLIIQLHDIKKGKVVQEEVLCSRCRSERHHKDQYPEFREYL